MPKPMTQDEKRQAMGKAGEAIIQNYFSKNGIMFTASVDQFDSGKDIVIDGKKIEIKTQVPYFLKKSVTFKAHQLNKCQNADYVYFICVPVKDRPFFADKKIYRIRGDQFKFSRYTTKAGDRMVSVPLEQDGMEEVFEMTDEEATILQRYTLTDWK